MKIFPVVHVGEVSVDQSIDQGIRAFEHGADGVYIIDMQKGSSDTDATYEVFNSIKAEYMLGFVGLNLLGMSARQTLQKINADFEKGALVTEPDDIWVDDIRRGIGLVPPSRVRQLYPNLPAITIHGGVAFKHTPTATNDPEKAATETRELRDYVDVITTSGQGTGQPPSVEKLEAMKEVARGKAIAVASGISIENIESYDGIVNEILAASSIETTPMSGIFDDYKLRDLTQIAHDLAR